jgi:hypothetical protein
MLPQTLVCDTRVSRETRVSQNSDIIVGPTDSVQRYSNHTREYQREARPTGNPDSLMPHPT